MVAMWVLWMWQVAAVVAAPQETTTGATAATEATETTEAPVHETVTTVAPATPAAASPAEQQEASVREFLAALEPESVRQCRLLAEADWRHSSRPTEQTERHLVSTQLAHARSARTRWSQAKQYDLRQIRQPSLRRQLQLISRPGTGALPDGKLTQYNQLKAGMQSTYTKARICDRKRANCKLSLEPDLTEILSTSRDPEELEHIWTSWRDSTGKLMRENYTTLVDIFNKAATLNEFADGADLWLAEYETSDFRSRLARLWSQLTPLYEQLHAFVRSRLRRHYGDQIVGADDPIPAHLLGNMWSEDWTNLLNICKPFPEKATLNVSRQMESQGYTPLKVFRTAESLLTSLDLQPMTSEFWNGSMLDGPADDSARNCRPGIWDFCDGRDIRVKQCTRVTTRDLIAAHERLGGAEYALQYKNQPQIFRTAASPGFAEAVGGVLALSVTPNYLHDIGLLEEAGDDPEVDLNLLMSEALEKVALLPFAYLADQWRWSVFSGDTRPADYNCQWWRLRQSVQGVQPPQPRTESDFDPGANYDIVSNTPYIRRFVATVVQFQLHQALCAAVKAAEEKPAGRPGPLHRCQLAGSQLAGGKLEALMRLGRSRPWEDALEAATGDRRLDATALRDYFQPLEDWLKRENLQNHEHVGWSSEGPVCQRELPTPLSQSDAAAVKTGAVRAPRDHAHGSSRAHRDHGPEDDDDDEQNSEESVPADDDDDQKSGVSDDDGDLNSEESMSDDDDGYRSTASQMALPALKGALPSLVLIVAVFA